MAITGFGRPTATYSGQDEDIGTIALSTQLVVRTDVDDDVVYAIIKSIFENLDYLQRVDPSMAGLSLDQALAGMAMPLHRGALRYYEEVGLIPKTASDDDAPVQAPVPVRQNDRRPGNAPPPSAIPIPMLPATGRSVSAALSCGQTRGRRWPGSSTGKPRSQQATRR